MKAEELMVGNWVSLAPGDNNDINPVQVVAIDYDKEISEDYVIDIVFPITGLVQFNCSRRSLKPIPITSEILEKNGFECNSNTKTFYRILSNEPNLVVEVRLWDKDTNVRIGKQCDGTFRVGYDWYINGMEIHFVHELQHALRLCGIEKEIII